MIINHRHKFIFIKTVKTAGTSFEIALSSVCGDDDILTPFGKDDENLRKKLGFVGARNYRIGENKFLPDKRALRRKSISHKLLTSEGFYNHTAAADVRKLLKRKFKTYFVFSIVRNPWDRIISHYYWMFRSSRPDERLTFRDFIRRNPQSINICERLLFDNSGGELLLDDFIKYEDLPNDIARISKKLGITSNLYEVMQAASAKTDVRPPSADRYGLFCDYSDKVVELLCEREIECFGYRRPF